MLTGTVAGGVVAQFTDLSVPYIMRIAALGLTFVLAYLFMHDEGFTPKRGGSIFREVRDVAAASINFGFRNAPIRWIMLSAPFSGGVAIFAFHAMQPFLLELYGNSTGYAIAGLAAGGRRWRTDRRWAARSVLRSNFQAAYQPVDRGNGGQHRGVAADLGRG